MMDERKDTDVDPDRGTQMDKRDHEKANQRRREEAARIIVENNKRKQLKDTNERLLDQEALRQAAIRAGLEKPGRK